MSIRLLLFLIVTSCFASCVFEQRGKDSDRQLLAIENQIYYYPHLVEQQVDSLKLLLRSFELHPHSGQIAFLCGFMDYHRGEMDSALIYIEKGLISYTRESNPEGKAKCNLLLGWIAEGAGYWEQAKTNYYKTIQLTNDDCTKENGLAWLGIARCKQAIKDPIDGEVKKGIKYLKSCGIKEFLLYVDFASFMFNEQNEEAATHLKNVAKEYLSMGLNNNASTTYKWLSKYYLHHGQYDSAQCQIDKAIDNYDETYTGSFMLPGFYQMKGVIYFYQKDYNVSRQYMLKSLNGYKKHKKENLSYYAYKYLFRVDTLQGDYKQAIFHQSKALYYNNAMQKKEKQLMSKIAEVDLGVLLLQQNIDELTYDNKINHMIYSVFIIIVFGVMFIVFQFMQYRHREKQHRERERAIQLQNILVGLGEKRLLQKKGDSAHVHFASLSDEFAECYMETIRLFTKDFPQLTDTEVRYAVMFALDLSAEVISEIQNVQTTTMRKVKQRIRQKLELQSLDSVEQYFQNHLELKDVNRY